MGNTCHRCSNALGEEIARDQVSKGSQRSQNVRLPLEYRPDNSSPTNGEKAPAWVLASGYPNRRSLRTVTAIPKAIAIAAKPIIFINVIFQSMGHELKSTRSRMGSMAWVFGNNQENQ
jgi:hypothetical protein